MNNPGLPIQNLGGGLFIALAPVLVQNVDQAPLQQPAQQAAALMQVAINALPAAISPAPGTPGAHPPPAGQAAAAVLPGPQSPVAPRALARNQHFQFNAVANAIPAPAQALAPSTPSQSGRTQPH